MVGQLCRCLPYHKCQLVQDKLKTQVDFLERNNNYKFSYSNYFVKQESDNRKFLRFKKNLKSGNITQDLLNNYSIGILTVLLEKEFFKEFISLKGPIITLYLVLDN